MRIHANSVDSDQTAPIEQSDLGPHCLSERLQIFQRSTKHTTFRDMRFVKLRGSEWDIMISE